MKSKPVAFLLWCLCLTAICGIHRLYMGKYVTGILWFLTLGMFGIGQLIDLFLISDRVDIANNRIAIRHENRTGRILGTNGRPAPVQHGHTPPPISRSRKRCPECAEFIQARAKSCRYCGTDLTLEPTGEEDKTTFCDCPQCGHLLEVPNHLLGIPGSCKHCGVVITPRNPADAVRAQA